MRGKSPVAVLATVLIPCLPLQAPAQSEGTTTFSVTTVAAGQRYDPRHILAIWVEDSAGDFVKTLKRRANSREQYLYTWVRESGRNVVDAVTGATISSHETHNVTWDGRDTDGNVVPDGEYRIRVEFTAAHEQGPITSASAIRFTKGPEEDSPTLANQDYFRNMKLTYRPDVETHTLVGAESTWKYNDQGVDLHATDWKLLDYDDSAWDEGPGKLGYSDSPATTLSFGGDADNKYPCYYFRHEFNTDFVPSSLKLSVLRDDGVVVYLNGTEVARDNMDPGPTSYADLANGTVGGGDESTYFQFYVEPTRIVVGRNIITAEVHQADVDSSDVGFDLELKSSPPPSEPPSFRRGDVDASGDLQITDALVVLNFLFLNGGVPECLSAADVNDDGDVDISDGIYVLVHLFLGDRPVPLPSPDCGQDPTQDDLGCSSYPACVGGG